MGLLDYGRKGCRMVRRTIESVFLTCLRQQVSVEVYTGVACYTAIVMSVKGKFHTALQGEGLPVFRNFSTGRHKSR